MQNPAPTCPRCGADLSADYPTNRPCERCLFSLGLAEDQPPMVVHTRHGAPQASFPSAEELARLHPDLEILEVLGEGGMGKVFRARQRNLDREVALKILRTDITLESGFAERFEREARTMARLNHPNIANVHDSGHAGNHYYLILELVDGTNLRSVIDAGNQQAAQSMAIVGQICDALAYAHGQGIVHRDIKPENILIDKEGRVKIVDFGLAKISHNDLHGLRLTRTDQAMGTPQYMAPEQIERPLEVDHRADIYSMGVVFYELLTGELPIGRFAPPSEKVKLDARLDRVVFRTLEKEPRDRYQDVSRVKTDMQGIRDEAPPALPKTPTGPKHAYSTARATMDRARRTRPNHRATKGAEEGAKKKGIGCGWLLLIGLLVFCLLGTLLVVPAGLMRVSNSGNFGMDQSVPQPGHAPILPEQMPQEATPTKRRFQPSGNGGFYVNEK